ncbi:baseplate hub subunit and tail lysozyme [Escherichia phage Bp7]|uniref:Baseplate central spike protein n=1 Tax=Escherichia phage Bp7 TaxID=1052121 RepID=G3MV56_9CAUD|nr:baseplate hub subunit and tail lysozyme [Escherichia phage Bp7]AEN93972.1 baseplate hub subunit and tail lysozyme [Escherichia phage Bp7]
MINMSDNVSWFVGVVEDRMDPLKQGRVRVRVWGMHPYEKVQGPVKGLRTEDLPWMSVLMPTSSASVSGIQTAMTGMVPGTQVYGHFLDKWKLNGLVLGTYGSASKQKANPNEGFSDPTGQYPLYLGNDAAALNRGGEVGYDATSNVIQDSNLDLGLNPDGKDLSQIKPDNDPNFTIEKMIQRDEGLSLKVYWDVRGYTVGIGHFIGEFAKGDMTGANKALSRQIGREVKGNPGSISIEEASKLFQEDLKKVQKDIVKTNALLTQVYNKENRSRQMALENMAFQMGVGGLAKFQGMLTDMLAGDYKAAFDNARDSVWFNQTKGRASRVSMVILTGNMESYGIMAPKERSFKGRSYRMIQTFAAPANSDPADPWTPEDTRILFKEPESSYKGEYPYVQTMQTEGGHIQEFDNTPGQERYRLIHPTGSYEEVAPDGRKTSKTVADGYYMTQGDSNTYVGGNNKVNVGGDETYYNMANVRRQTDGSESIHIRGNETKTVEGDGTLLVKGNVKIVIMGTADITVEQEAYITVEKDTTVNVNQNADISVKQKATINAQNMDVNVEQDLNFAATNINLNASNTVHMDGGSLAKVSGGNVQVG